MKPWATGPAPLGHHASACLLCKPSLVPLLPHPAADWSASAATVLCLQQDFRQCWRPGRHAGGVGALRQGRHRHQGGALLHRWVGRGGASMAKLSAGSRQWFMSPAAANLLSLDHPRQQRPARPHPLIAPRCPAQAPTTASWWSTCGRATRAARWSSTSASSSPSTTAPASMRLAAS